MHCIESSTSRRRWLAVATFAVAGCAQQAPAPSPAPLPPPVAAPAPPPVAPPASPATSGRVSLPPPTVARNKDELKRLAALRIVAANPDGTYMGKPQELLLGVPVLEIELNGNGSVKSVKVLREPSSAKETTKLAIDAIHRAAPFGDVSKLPKPWTWVETFLFNSDKRFKPRTLD